MTSIFIFVATAAVCVDGERCVALVMLPMFVGTLPFRVALWLTVRATVTTVTVRHRPTEAEHPASTTVGDIFSFLTNH